MYMVVILISARNKQWNLCIPMESTKKRNVMRMCVKYEKRNVSNLWRLVLKFRKLLN